MQLRSGILLLAVVCAPLVGPRQSQAQSSLTNGLAAYFPFNGNANDASGNGKHGVVVNALPTNDRFGNSNAAYKFSGADSFIDMLPNQPLTGLTTGLTIAGWLRADAVQSTKGIFFHRGDYADIGVRVVGSPMRLEFVTLASSYGGNNNLLVSYSTIPVSNWVFFAATYDGGLKRLYINGALESSVGYTGILNWNSASFTGETISGNFPGQAESFNGGLDDIRLYNRALSSNEVALLYSSLPFIDGQPASMTASVTSNLSLSVTAGGPGPLSYQWRKDGVDLTGATEMTLGFVNVQTNQAGNYTVVVTNTFGSVTSSVATLTVNRLNQSISFSPLAGKRADDAPFSLAASASSGLAVSYSSSISGVATVSGSTVTLTGVGSTSIIASQAGNATYLAAIDVSQTLVVAAVPPSITTPPTGQSFTLGGGLTLGVTAAGTGPLSYQWQFKGANLAGANGSTLTLSNLSATNAGAYRVVITNTVGIATSLPVDVYFFGDLKFIAATVLAGSIGQQYRVDYADVVTVGATNWLVLTNVTLPYSPFLVIDPASPGKTQRYYRAVPLP
jgi:hypothetical protein